MNEKMQLPLFVDKTSLPTGKNHISYSELMDWFECSHRHKLKHVMKLYKFDASVHTIFGHVLHSALETYVVTGKTPTAEECINEFKKKVGEILFTDRAVTAETCQEFIEAIPELLEHGPKFLDEEYPGWKLISAEEQLFEPIDGQTNIYFKGFIDLVIKVPKKKTGLKTRLSGLKGEVVPGEYVYWIIDWKGQRLLAPILTPNGWTTMGELSIGQEITSSEGTSCKVTGIFPLGEREVYRVHLRDGTFVDVTDDHLWQVFRSDGYSKIMTTKDLQSEKKYVYLPTLSSPAQFHEKYDYPINPYVLGLLLGDGTLGKSVKFTSADSELFGNLMSLAPSEWSLGYVNNDKKTPTQTIKGAIKQITLLGLKGSHSHAKHIPQEYLFGTPEQRLSLMQGLLDTDGWVQKGIPKYSTTSKALAEGMRQLTNSLGGVAFLSERRKKRKPTEHKEYIVTVKLPNGLVPFRLARKLNAWNPTPKHRADRRRIIRIEKVGRDQMQCISVSAPDSLYVTKDFVVTHNTTNWGWQAKQKRSFQKHMQLIFYKYFWCKKHGIDLKDARAGFGFLRRRAMKDGTRVDVLPVSVGPKAVDKALKVLHDGLNQIRTGRTLKNKYNCMWCPYKFTKHCP